MGTISFRPFDKAADSRIVSEFLLDTKELSGTPHEDPQKDSEAYIEHIVSTQTRNPDFAAVILKDERVIGFVHVYPLPQKPEVAFLPFDYIVKELRGQGLGAHLMDYALNMMKAHNCVKIALDVSRTTTPAISFYRKHKFAAVKEHGQYLRMSREI